jgi:hypothetical protein
LKKLLEYVINKFNGDDYKNDLRYLKIWCMYTDLCEDGYYLFSQMQKQNIGLQYALFYEYWAKLLIADENYKGAEKIYKKGLNRFISVLIILTFLFLRETLPEGSLQKSYTNFLNYLNNHNINNHQETQSFNDQHLKTTYTSKSFLTESSYQKGLKRIIPYDKFSFEIYQSSSPSFDNNDSSPSSSSSPFSSFHLSSSFPISVEYLPSCSSSSSSSPSSSSTYLSHFTLPSEQSRLKENREKPMLWNASAIPLNERIGKEIKNEFCYYCRFNVVIVYIIILLSLSLLLLLLLLLLLFLLSEQIFQ